MRSFARLPVSVVALAAFITVAAPVRAADGVLIVERTTTGGTARTNQIQIAAQQMRAETTDAEGRVQVVIFDGAKQVMWVVDTARKSYTEMTKADVDRMGGQLSAAMAQMQEQLKNLPPAQRAQFEAMMKGRGMTGLTPVRTEYRKTGTEKVGAWTCVRYEGFQNDEKTSEICAVNPGDLGFTAADFAVSRQLAEFFRSLMPQSTIFTVGAPEEQGFSGVPVRRTSGIGPRQSTTEITEIRRDTFADSLFTVPAGFTRQALPGAPGR